MSEQLNPAAPAPSAAAPAPAITVQSEIATLNKQTVLAFVNDARRVGKQEGDEAAVERAKAIFAVCPEDPRLAIESFIAGHSPATVKLAHDRSAAVRAEAQKAAEDRERELARLRAELASVGHPGVGMLPIDLVEVGNEPKLDPKAQAEREWDLKPSVREGFSSRENYVNFRKMELEGRIQFSR